MPIENENVAPKQEKLYNSSIYSSYEQFKQMEAKINNQNNLRARTNIAHSGKEQPSMGMTSAILKHHKKTNHISNQNGRNTGLCASIMPNFYLIGAPIVFNSTDLVQKESNEKCQESNYDRLQRPQFISEYEAKKASTSGPGTTKKIVKSLSSLINPPVSVSKNITPAKLSSYKSSSVQKTKVNPPLSVYNKSSNNLNKKLEKELLYESLNDSVF